MEPLQEVCQIRLGMQIFKQRRIDKRKTWPADVKSTELVKVAKYKRAVPSHMEPNRSTTMGGIIKKGLTIRERGCQAMNLKSAP